MSIPFELLIHPANVLYLLAYMVRDILWLRDSDCGRRVVSHSVFLFSSRATHGGDLLEPGLHRIEHLLDNPTFARTPPGKVERGRTAIMWAGFSYNEAA